MDFSMEEIPPKVVADIWSKVIQIAINDSKTKSKNKYRRLEKEDAIIWLKSTSLDLICRTFLPKVTPEGVRTEAGVD